MATLVTRINDLAGSVRDKFNQVMPRLLPPGGNAGQALVKASNADNSVYWADVAAGSSGAAWGSITGNIASQTDLNNALGSKANLASPALTGVPTAPTAATGTNSTQLATTAFVQTAVPAVPSYSYPYQNTGYYTAAGVRGTTVIYPNSIYLMPFTTVYPFTLGSLAVQVSSGSGSGQARFGIYTLNQGVISRRFALVSQPPNPVNWNTNTYMLTSTYTFNYTLPPGKYFLAIQTNAQLNVRSLEASDGMFADTIGCGNDSLAFGAGIAGFSYNWNYTGGLISSSTGFSATSSAPLIGMQHF